MSQANQKTLESYNARANQYEQNTPGAVLDGIKQWLDRTVAGLPKTARIVEIGSGPGRDAKYLSGLGYKIECTDAAPAFVAMLRQKGLQARVLNIIKDDLPGKYDAIISNAVFLHFTPDELEQVIAKIYNGLSSGGVLAFSLIERDEGEVWYEGKLGVPRYFRYWKRESITTLLEKAGFGSIEFTDCVVADASWLQVITRKVSLGEKSQEMV
jgi:SAM-dependent methyltransferase